MRVTLLLAHPAPDSLTHRFADHLQTDLEQRGHAVTRRDLYAEGYGPLRDRDTHTRYRAQTPSPDQNGLSKTEGLVMVFPVWWGGPPAILKGWMDQELAPGVAYHPPEHPGGPLRPGLTNLRAALVVTTMGAPAWYDRLVMRQPLRRILHKGVLRPCAPQARFGMLSFHGADHPSAHRLRGFETRLSRAATHLFPTEA